jgi:predicted nucleic acid-binding protein
VLLEVLRSVAIEHELILLHDDRDFEHMAGVIPKLAFA